MRFSEAWLREWANPTLGTDELVQQITMAGLEVDATDPVAGEFSGVVVGEIVAIEQHPDADKLRVCQVAGNGDDTIQVVCGAPNARTGIKIPFATVGALLPPGADGKPFKIKKAKLRGVESFGMLCAQTELQCGDDDDGLWELPSDAPVGTDLREYLQLNDTIIEVDLTPNRSDCLSIQGLAREVGTLNKVSLTEPDIAPVAPQINDRIQVRLDAPEACPCYVGRILTGVDRTIPSPLWLQERLRRSGIGAKDVLVDVTNYVMLELGQPMHAFDLGKLSGDIVVRMAKPDEELTLLVDDKTVKMADNTLVIADEQKALAMAGVMGGANSAVSDTTQDILLESAFFAPLALAGRARQYGLHTDSSHRFERGVDFQLQEKAIERATALIQSIAGGQAGPVVKQASAEHLPKTTEITLRRERILSGLGFELADNEVEAMLGRLGLTLKERTDAGWVFIAPSYRFDLSIEADLLEEIARVYGYNNLPTSTAVMPIEIPAHDERKQPLSLLRRVLVGRDYQEVISYSFVDPKLAKLLDPEVTAVPLQNPISADMAVMRTNLWAGLINSLQHNLNRQQSRVRLFETGLRFVSSDGTLAQLSQEQRLSGLIYGDNLVENCHEKLRPIDFFDAKGDVEALLTVNGALEKAEFVAAKHPALHPGQTAEIRLDGKVVGILGALHPQVQKELGLERSVFVFELDLAAVTTAPVPAFKPLSRFPVVRRDLAILMDVAKPVGDAIQVATSAAGEFLKSALVFDVYQGKGIDSEQKSVALGLTFQHPSRTLTDEEINAAIDAVLNQLQAQLNATLR